MWKAPRQNAHDAASFLKSAPSLRRNPSSKVISFILNAFQEPSSLDVGVPKAPGTGAFEADPFRFSPPDPRSEWVNAANGKRN